MSATSGSELEDLHELLQLENELKQQQAQYNYLTQTRDSLITELKSQELKISESKNVMGLYKIFRLKLTTQKKLQTIEKQKQHIGNAVTTLENKIKMRMQSMQPQTWEQTVFNETSIDEHCDDLTHLSNKFVDTKNIDLTKILQINNSDNSDNNSDNGSNNNDKTSRVQEEEKEETMKQIENALNIANKRVFGDSYVKSENINVTKTYVNGKFEVMVPNGDIKIKIFQNEPVLSANVTFNDNENKQEITSTTSIEDEKTDNNNNNNNLIMATRVFYDSDGFRPIRNMLETKAGIIINTNNIDNTTDNTVDSKDNSDYLKLIERTSNRLTKNYVSRMTKKRANMSKIMFNRTKPIPQLVMKNFDIKQIPKAAQESCRAYFTGRLVGGMYEDQISKCYVIDDCSEYVGQGDYCDNRKAFPKAVEQTFDGIAVDKNTRVIIYEKANFEGKILLDRKGPAIINNIIYKDEYTYEEDINDTWKNADLELQRNFPPEVREWSETDMHDWSYGSLRVISNM